MDWRKDMSASRSVGQANDPQAASLSTPDPVAAVLATYWPQFLERDASGRLGADILFASEGMTFNDGVDVYAAQSIAGDEQQSLLSALEAFGRVIDLDIRVTADAASADIVFFLSDDFPDDEISGFCAACIQDVYVVGLNVDQPWRAARMFEPGSIAFNVALHELGHAFGLMHMHDDGGGSQVWPGTSTGNPGVYAPGLGDLNQGVHTVMSYNWGWPLGPNGAPSDQAHVGNGWAKGLSPLDIAALHARFGARADAAPGDDLYSLATSDGPGAGYQGIWDTGGRDAIAFDGAARAYIDLRAATLEPEAGGGGWLSWAEGVVGGYTIAYGAIIEHAYGGEGCDQILGNAADNALLGRGGDDWIVGGPGDDWIDGGPGTDAVGFASLRLTNAMSEIANGKRVSGPEGVDDAVFMESFQFIDGTLSCSPESEIAQVFRLYRASFAREPDFFGLNGWSDRLAAGSTLESVAAGFVQSAEFAALYGGLSDADFVSTLYRNVLGREGEPDGAAAWLAMLEAGWTRAGVTVGFSESVELKALTAEAYVSGLWNVNEEAASVSRFYLGLFGRNPDASGLVHWAGRAAAGIPLADIAGAFLGAPEYAARFGAPSDEDLVGLLYGNVLGRAPSPAETAAWIGALGSGLSRESMVVGFTDSTEFQIATAPLLDGGIDLWS